MKLLYLSTILFLFSVCGYGQNLVPNGDFEDTVSCPISLSQIDRAAGWYSYSSSPDYYNACAAPSTGVSVPDNNTGHRYAASGNAYCGIINYIVDDTADYSINREIIGRQLTSPLVIGQKYFASFQVSLCGSNIATDKIGVLFSTKSYTNIDSTTMPPIKNFAHIYSDSIISDTIGWVRVCGSFIADSVYTHISLGNFFKNNNTDTSILWHSPFGGGAYYLVDDIRVSLDSLFTVTALTKITQASSIVVYPNPSSGLIKIKVPESLSKNSIQVFNTIGQTIFYQKFIESGQLDLSFLENGLYKIIITNNRTQYFTKLIIQK